jgi:cytochrome c oxidase cbb3-type subunit III
VKTQGPRRPWRGTSHRWALLGALALLLTGCGKPNPADRPKRPDQVLNFTKLFDDNCKACHGGAGKGGAAPALNDKLFLGIVTDAQLEGIIRDGRARTLMPPFGLTTGPVGVRPTALRPAGTGPVVQRAGGLTEEQIKALVAGLRQWGRTNPQLAPYASLLQKSVPGDVGAGKLVFAQSCANCHGEDGKGHGKDGKASDAGALNNPAFLALISDQALRRLVFTGRPDLKRKLPSGADISMPGFEGHGWQQLSPEDIANVVALMASWPKTEMASR